MPKPAEPLWHKSKKVWYANVGARGADGRAKGVYMVVPVGGVAPPEGPNDRRQAHRWLDAHQAEQERAAAAAAAPIRPTVLAVTSAYVAWSKKAAVAEPRLWPQHRNRVSCLKHVCEAMGDEPADSLTDQHHEDLMAALKKAGYSPHYRRGIHRVFMACLNWAASPRGRKLIPANPLDGVSPPVVKKVRGRYIPGEQLGQFLVWAAGRARYLAEDSRHFERVYLRYWLFLLATGCRPGEAIRLRWDQVPPGARAIILEEHKTAERTGDDRVIPLGPRARRILDRLRKGPRRHPELVFPHRPAKGRGRPKTEEERFFGQAWASPQEAAKALLRLRRRAIAAGCELLDEGPGRLISYSGRYRSVTDKLRAGLSKEIVARLHGHSPQMVTEVYEQLADDDLADLLDDLES